MILKHTSIQGPIFKIDNKACIQINSNNIIFNCFVDDEFYHDINFNYYLSKNGSYIITRRRGEYNKSESLHKIVMISSKEELPDNINKYVIDHINNNSFDNRKENLQYVSESINAHRRLLKNNKSGYKGISIKNGNYCVSICVDGINKYFGSYNELNDAIEVWNKNAIERYGDNAIIHDLVL